MVTASSDGPQGVSVRGVLKAVVISIEEYEHLRCPKETLLEFMQQSPLYGVDLDLSRDKSLTKTSPCKFFMSLDG